MSEGIPTIKYETTSEKKEDVALTCVRNVVATLDDIIHSAGDGQVINIDALRTVRKQLLDAEGQVLILGQKLENANQDARVDHLTGLANKRAFEESLHTAIASCNRAPHTIHIVAIDIDGFKAINDTYGHAIGNLYLKHIAKHLHSAIARGTDIIARVGGDEFMAILLDANEPGTEIVVQHIGDAVLAASTEARHALKMRTSVSIPDELGNVSASIGYTVFDLGKDTPESLEERADYALYVVKAAGKHGALSDTEARTSYDENGELHQKFLAEKQKDVIKNITDIEDTK